MSLAIFCSLRDFDNFRVLDFIFFFLFFLFFFCQAEDGIRDLVRSRGLGDVYKRQGLDLPAVLDFADAEIGLSAEIRDALRAPPGRLACGQVFRVISHCLLYTSDAADERSSVDLGGRRIIKKKRRQKIKKINKKRNQSTAHGQ